MRILFVVRNISYGGACKQLAITANALAEKGHDIHVFTYNDVNIQQKLISKVTYHPAKSKLKNKLLEYIYAPLRIRKKIISISPNIVISWRANAGCMSVIASIGLKVKTIFSERTDPYLETNPLLKVATRIAELSDGGVFQTSMARDYYKRLINKSVVIPNAIGNKVTLPQIIPYEERPKEIAFVGRFEIIQKRQDIMLKAFKLINQALPDYILSFYGDGTSLSDIKQLTQQMHLDNNVIFHGSVTNIVEKIKYARLLIMTSDYEGIPNTLIEAFQAGTPIVTTDCSPGGARIVIDNEINGYIVPPRDYKAISEKAIILLKDPQLSMKFIINGRKKLIFFEPNKIFNQWEEYIKSVFQNRI